MSIQIKKRPESREMLFYKRILRQTRTFLVHIIRKDGLVNLILRRCIERRSGRGQCFTYIICLCEWMADQGHGKVKRCLELQVQEVVEDHDCTCHEET